MGRRFSVGGGAGPGRLSRPLACHCRSEAGRQHPETVLLGEPERDRELLASNRDPQTTWVAAAYRWSALTCKAERQRRSGPRSQFSKTRFLRVAVGAATTSA